MEKLELRDVVEDAVSKLSHEELVKMTMFVRDYADTSLRERLDFYEMGTFDEMNDGIKPLDLVDKLVQPFDTLADYYKFTIYGMESCSVEDLVGDIKNDLDVLIDIIVAHAEEDSFIDQLPDYLVEAIDDYLYGEEE